MGSIEDHLPFVRDLYPKAVAEYLAELIDGEIVGAKDGKSSEDVKKGVKQSFGGKFKGSPPVAGIGKWTDEVCEKHVSCDTGVSKFNIARKYADLLDEKMTLGDGIRSSSEENQRSFKLAKSICEWLPLPKKTADTSLFES